MNKLDLKQLAEDWNKSDIDGLIFDQDKAGEESVFSYFGYSYKKLGKTFLITPPLAPLGYESVPEGSEVALDKFIDFLEKNHDKDYIHLILKTDVKWKHLLEGRGYEVVEKPNFVLDITAHPDDIKQGLSRTRRTHINKSERELTLGVKNNRDQVFDLFRETYHKNGLSIPEAFFQNLQNQSTGHEQILSAVYREDDLLAANLCLKSGEVAYYLLGGVSTKFKLPYPGSYSLWNCILTARELGAKKFDFCGSSVHGIARFFKSFGAVEKTYLEIKKGHKGVDFMKKIKSSLSH